MLHLLRLLSSRSAYPNPNPNPNPNACEEGDRSSSKTSRLGSFKLKDVVETIREDLNPHPAGQKERNTPKKEELAGVQHTYQETVPFFPAAAQTCHAYCM